MYRFYINRIENDYHYGELARVFLPDDEFEVIPLDTGGRHLALRPGSFLVNESGSDDRDEIKRELYKLLVSLTDRTSDWGTLTGVRPLKLAYEMLAETDSTYSMCEALAERYLISASKIALLREIAEYQISQNMGDPSSKAGVYIGIPFCPTRCEYCAFASNVAGADEIAEYLTKLLEEIRFMGQLVREHGTEIESIYIGGGTPTTLEADQLKQLIETGCEEFRTDPGSIEFTVEAGRPDTITAEKLAVMRKLGVSRISINPQSMKDETLRAIGRDHSAEDIRSGYRLAGRYGFEVINADLIAGLTGEDIEDFMASLEEIIDLGANNITVHTLSVKKGSRLRENDPEYYRRNTMTVQSMVDYARERLAREGFVPYYIYRQKHQMGALENVGYCRPGLHSVYNIRIMEEKQTIIGLGAGAIGKVYYPDEDRLERVANVSNYKVYCERFDEMLARKLKYYE
ncbi:MAG: coproporphyrinogen dehydrogenase HemZ [Mogibacterium sp.]|nr:coproporphyrinogen dehydrogenase HemZ [Mogibacterium sp.]